MEICYNENRKGVRLMNKVEQAITSKSEEGASVTETEKKVRLHSSYDKNECSLQKHGPFLFIEDVSERNASDCKNRFIYHCACLECGREADYSMSPSYRRLVVYPKVYNALSTFYVIQGRYAQLKPVIDEKEEIVGILNRECQENTVNCGEQQYIKKIIPNGSI